MKVSPLWTYVLATFWCGLLFQLIASHYLKPQWEARHFLAAHAFLIPNILLLGGFGFLARFGDKWRRISPLLLWAALLLLVLDARLAEQAPTPIPNPKLVALLGVDFVKVVTTAPILIFFVVFYIVLRRSYRVLNLLGKGEFHAARLAAQKMSESTTSQVGTTMCRVNMVIASHLQGDRPTVQAELEELGKAALPPPHHASVPYLRLCDAITYEADLLPYGELVEEVERLHPNEAVRIELLRMRALVAAHRGETESADKLLAEHRQRTKKWQSRWQTRLSRIFYDYRITYRIAEHFYNGRFYLARGDTARALNEFRNVMQSPYSSVYTMLAPQYIESLEQQEPSS